MSKPCIICYKLVTGHEIKSLRPPPPHHRPQNGGEVKKVNNDEAEKLLVRFFRLLGRHLEDIGGGDDGDDGGTMHFPIKKFVIGGLLSCCGDCSKIVADFCHLSHQIKVIELHLQWKLSSLKNIMSCAQRVPGRLRGFREGAAKAKRQDLADFDPDELIDLKRDLIQKCRLKLQAPFPRVVARKCDDQKGTEESVDPDPAEFSPPAVVTPTEDVDLDDAIIPPPSPYETVENDCHSDTEHQSNAMESEEPACQNPGSENDDIETADIDLKLCPPPTSPRTTVRKRKAVPARFSCRSCGKSFTSPSNRSQHMRLHCPGRKSTITGSSKTRSWSSSSSPRGRMQRVQTEARGNPLASSGETGTSTLKTRRGRRLFPCRLCSKTFTQAGSRDRHMKGYCPKRPSPKVNSRPAPSVRGRPKSKKDNNPSNIPLPSSVTDPVTGKLNCGLCTKTFEDRSGYKDHFRSVHLNIRYHCNKCPMVFRQRRTLKDHIQFTHLGGGYKCRTCEKSFSSCSYRWQHMRLFCPGRKSLISSNTGSIPSSSRGRVEMQSEAEGNISDTFILPDDIPEDPLLIVSSEHHPGTMKHLPCKLQMGSDNSYPVPLD